jgi:putative ABC transport system permease protein
LLIASVLFAALILTRRVEASQGRVGISNLVFQNLRQNRSRSLMVIILLAIGTYLVVSTGMNRKDFFAKLADKQSGTGGFLFWAESTVPILHNLNDLQYRQEQGFVEDFKVVQFHAAQGDDASCLNLNRIANPRVLGVDSDLLQGRFSFQTKLNSINGESDLWGELQRDYGDCVPAIADQTVILWSLGKMVGDTLLYRNSLGDDVKLLLIGGLAPSVFQGNVLIDNRQFLKHFPTTSGSSVFLVEGLPEQQESIAEELLLTYRDSGWEMTLTADRLALFNSIERTYLTIFLILGAFGLLIGTFGLAIVLQRSVLDRKAELALLQAVGFGRKQILGVLLSEFSLLLVYGILVGFVSALVSVWPSVGLQFQDVSLGFVGILMLVIVANGLFWIVIVAKSQLKKLKLIEALRND